MCAQKLFRCIRVAPYVLDDRGGVGGGSGNDGDDTGSSRHRHGHHTDGGGRGGSSHHSVWPKPARVMAFALKDDTEVTNCMVSAAQLDADGEVVDFITLPGLMYSGRSQREDLKKQRVSLITFLRRLSLSIRLLLYCASDRMTIFET